MKIIKQLPLPICGLALGLVALGNLLGSYHETLRLTCALISSIIIILVITLFLFNSEKAKKQLENVVVASVFPTFFMTLVLLAPNYFQFSKPVGYFLWFVGTIGHLFYVGIFTRKYVFNFEMKNVFPSWFIVYVGYVVSANTSKLFGFEQFGHFIWFIGIALFFVLLFLITYCIRNSPGLPPLLQPLLVIYTAPLNLCLVGYLSLFQDSDKNILFTFLGISLTLFVFALSRFPKIIKNGFFPTHSALTFPIVISAIAYKQTIIKLELNLPYLINGLELIAAIVVGYVLIEYLIFLRVSNNKLKKEC